MDEDSKDEAMVENYWWEISRVTNVFEMRVTSNDSIETLHPRWGPNSEYFREYRGKFTMRDIQMFNWLLKELDPGTSPLRVYRDPVIKTLWIKITRITRIQW